MDVPPLSELTLCVWVRVTSVESDQSIFTYVGADDKRIMRLWLDSGGRRLRIALEDDRVAGSAAVEFAAGAWRDVCVSYQSDHGVWAMYVDAKLISCQGSRYLRGFEFPGKGRLIIGYGTSEKGLPTGLTGEIYGASMLSLSTIERNITIDPNNWNRLEPRLKNQHISNEGDQYIVLGDLQNDDIQTVNPRTINKEYDFLSSDNMKIFSRPFTNAPVPSNEHKHEFSIDENLPSNKKAVKKILTKHLKIKKLRRTMNLKKN
ncbi:uncharacterized protein LOC125240575 isoform X2 [Leguminivora glycinivorella]|nr:uncharacterized protein LOC125240575 isoform X2 [Leguminivora glycinivorella]